MDTRKTLRAVRAAFLALLAAAGTTAPCRDSATGFGKDFFYGTWQTFAADDDGNYYSVTWWFDGTSQDIAHYGSGGTFTQHLINYGADATGTQKVDETYWKGSYKITADAAHNRGTLFLFYKFGIDLYGPDASGARYEDVKSWSFANFLNYAFYRDETGAGQAAAGLDLLDVVAGLDIPHDQVHYGATGERKESADGTGSYYNNGVLVQVRGKERPVCSDIERFSFALGSPSGTGYTRMTISGTDRKGAAYGATFNGWCPREAASQPAQKACGAYKVRDGSSWRVQSRSQMQVTLNGNGADDRAVQAAARP